ncbi:hypothetical protein EJ05DRAFT_507272 [Pseudovirgaria hyperparasitica]|uniref:Uncharacterized protein n=1 Tax=Pseudovirgaria hyperparasitica TaxID=470096 RepID=A0A6A6WFU8_9PEZI|nr:uncharacterized protein EJ05DRAFT_507272 [Pseudovirgaria hyperparasitica]KAF2761623.1 hypothetical protein EJ05DRAFT_507272 [Pseudovirgaria hyperparasitica]
MSPQTPFHEPDRDPEVQSQLDDEQQHCSILLSPSDMSRASFREPPHEDTISARTEDALNMLRSKVPRGVISNASELDQFINNIYWLFRSYINTIQFVTCCHTHAQGYASYAAIIAQDIRQDGQSRERLILLAKGQAYKPGDVNGYTFYNYADDDRGARYDARFRDLRQKIDEMMHLEIARAEQAAIEGRSGGPGGMERR